MFDLSSAPPAPENKKATAWEEGLVNINVVLQKALQQLAGEERNRIILRCDELPFVSSGREGDYRILFTGLLQMILPKKERISAKLFLHVHCNPEEAATRNITGLKWFTIQFNSNLSSCAGWLRANGERISEMAAILNRNGGNLAVNQTAGSGCIFSFSVPGKNP